VLRVSERGGGCAPMAEFVDEASDEWDDDGRAYHSHGPVDSDKRARDMKVLNKTLREESNAKSCARGAAKKAYGWGDEDDPSVEKIRS
jgi:hypothetical protein